MTETIISELRDGLLSLTFNRPEKKNALTDAMYGALADGLDRAAADDDVRCVLLRSLGDCFTAGNDISSFAARGSSNPESATNAVRFMKGLATAPKPLVAAVRGRAVGIGLTMLLHCDLVIVADDATLSAPFVNLGLVPEAASSLLMVERIGHARAFAVVAMGETFSGTDAVAWGIANRALPEAAVDDAARQAAAKLAASPMKALSVTKSLLRDADTLVRRIDEERRHFADGLASWEAQEAFRAFAERRAPDFLKRPATRDTDPKPASTP